MVLTGVGDVGAIIGIADVATRVGLRLGRFLEDSKDAGETRSNLYKKVTDLQHILEAVRAATTERKGHVRTTPISDDEGRILKILTVALDRCKSTVEKLAEKLGSLGRGGTEPNWRQRAMLQLRLDVQGPSIVRIEKDIQADIEALQLLHSCLST